MNKIIEYDIDNSDSEVFIFKHKPSNLLSIKSLDTAIEKMVVNQKICDSILV